MRTLSVFLLWACISSAQERAAQVQCGAATLSANAITCSPSPALQAYTDGLMIVGRVVGEANTGATTINVSSLGALTLKKLSGGAYVDVASGDLIAGQPFACVRASSLCYLTTPVATSPAAGDSSDLSTTFDLREDFAGGSNTSPNLGLVGWAWAGGSSTAASAYAGTPGALLRSTGSTINTVAYTHGGTMLDPADTFDLRWRVRVNHTDSDTTVRVGFNCGSVSALQPAHGIYFERLGADTNWFGVTRNTNSENRINTGSAMSTNWVVLRVRRSGSSIYFSVDGGTEVSLSATIPTTTCAPWTVITNLAAAAKTIDHDYMRLTITGLTR